MPLIYYKAWNTSSNAPETGDVANHTITLDVDGTTVAGLTPTEDANGVYHVEPSDAQLPVGSQWVLHGSSSTADVQIFGTTGWRSAQDADTETVRKILYNKTIVHPTDSEWQQVLDDDGETPWMEFRLLGDGTRERREPT